MQRQLLYVLDRVVQAAAYVAQQVQAKLVGFVHYQPERLPVDPP